MYQEHLRKIEAGPLCRVVFSRFVFFFCFVFWGVFAFHCIVTGSGLRVATGLGVESESGGGLALFSRFLGGTVDARACNLYRCILVCVWLLYPGDDGVFGVDFVVFFLWTNGWECMRWRWTGLNV